MLDSQSMGPVFKTTFILLRLIKWKLSGNLVVKSKLPPRSDPSLEAVEPHPEKGTIKFFYLAILNELDFIGNYTEKILKTLLYTNITRAISRDYFFWIMGGNPN